MHSRPLKWLLTLLVLALLLLAVSVFSMCIGETGISPDRIIPLILHGKGSAPYSILIDIRLPRVLMALAVGGALSVAGIILQGMFRNPLVEPYTLGISGGASLGVCVALVFGLSRVAGGYSLPLCGFAGAFCVILFLNLLIRRQSILGIQGLLLAGVMINFICSSAVMLIMATARAEDLHGILFWIIGSLAETDWFLVRLALMVSFCGLVLVYLFCFDLNALALGDEDALHLGVEVKRTKKLLLLLASSLTGICVSLVGAIGFVGLVVPHFMRMVVGVDHRALLACSFLAGGTFLIFCDTIAKTIAFPIDLPAGVVTGILGGVLFIYTIGRRGFRGWIR